MDIHQLRIAQTLSDVDEVIEVRLPSLKPLRDAMRASSLVQQKFAAIHVEERCVLFVAVTGIGTVYRLTEPNAADLPLTYSAVPDYEIMGWCLEWRIGERAPRVVPLQMYAEMDPVGSACLLRIRRAAAGPA